MDVHANPQSEYGRFEQILTQFLLKSLHIILNSRIPLIRPCGARGEVKKSDKWFNLVLGDRPAALENLNFWHRNLMQPMIIDIILVQEMQNSSFCDNLHSSGLGTFTETIVERWVVRYEHLRMMTPQTDDASYKKVYKKSIILLRSLYSMMRLLPAYKAFQKLSSANQTSDLDVNYKVSVFGAPFSRAEEDLMKQYSFVPIDAHQGRLTISVTYRENLSDFNLETSASFPPEIIMDYVGSPLADPMRSFPSSLGKGYRAPSLSSRGMHSPTSTPFQRPHSWTSGLHREVCSPQSQPFSGSPPLYRAPSEFSSTPFDVYGQRTHEYGWPAHHKPAGFDDYQLSPPFSPSPPAYHSGGNHARTRLFSETSPVSIPHSMMSRNSRYISPNLSDPNRHALPPMSPRSTKHDSPSQESPSGISSLRKPESLKSGESSYGVTNLGQKVSRDAKEDSGRFSGLLSSSGSPRVGFSSSSRLSFQDDLDEGDFSCPFIVDDIDTADSQASHNLGGKRGSEASSQALSMGRKSQDAAVGALVHMLRTAPPLRQDSSSCYASESSKSELEGDSGTSSRFFMTRKTSDALEELKAYKELKELLLSKSVSRVSSSKGETSSH